MQSRKKSDTFIFTVVPSADSIMLGALFLGRIYEKAAKNAIYLISYHDSCACRREKREKDCVEKHILGWL